MNAREVKQNLKMAEWSQLIQQCQDSGLTIAEWCSQTGTSRDKYYYWLRMIRKQACTALEANGITESNAIPVPQVPSFTKVNLTQKVGPAGIKINSHGLEIEIEHGANTEHVRIVLEAMLNAR